MNERRRMLTMAKRILTPIDGREPSETIVPVVAALARGAGSTVRLLRVFPVPEHVVGPYGRTIAYVDQEMARLSAEGMDELARVDPAQPVGHRARPRCGRAAGAGREGAHAGAARLRATPACGAPSCSRRD